MHLIRRQAAHPAAPQKPLQARRESNAGSREERLVSLCSRTSVSRFGPVDGTDARRAEQTPFISQVVDLQGFWIRTRNALSRVSSVKCCHLRNPGRLAWHDRTPVGCGVQPKRLVKVRERGRLAQAARRMAFTCLRLVHGSGLGSWQLRLT